VTVYQMAGGELVSSEVLAARTALADGLAALRGSMREMLSTALRGEGRFPRTRQAPPHTNEAPAGHIPSPNSRTSGTRSGGPPTARAGDSGPASTAEPGAAGEPGAVDVLDAADDKTAETGAGGGRPPTGFPDRPDPGDAAAEVWALVERAQAGEAAAFGMIYDRYFDTVFRFVYFRVGNRQLAEDLTSDTFLRALKRICSFTWQGRDLGAWLVTIARNLVADHFKSGRYRLEVTTGDVLDAEREDRGPEGSPEAAVVDHITNVALLKAVKQLNPEQQECIVLRFLHGFSVAETANAMNKNEGAIKALQYRAVRALARLLPDGFQP
jgi:RNA polymerase sigma-70 factor (ECF subfamily)